MRVLFTALEVPYPPNRGHRMRLWALLRALAAAKHHVSVVSFATSEEAEQDHPELRSLGVSVDLVPLALKGLSEGGDYLKRLAAIPSPRPYSAGRFRSEAFSRLVNERLTRERFDVALMDEVYLVPNLPDLSPVPVLVDTHHVAWVMLGQYARQARNPLARLYAWLEYRKMRRWEAGIYARTAGLIACSELEEEVLRGMCPRLPVTTVRNVVEVAHYDPTPDPGGETVLYTGGMDWYPNRDAVEFFAFDVLPRLRSLVPGVRFVVAGRAPSEAFRRRFEGTPGLTFTGTVPDMRTEIARATVCVVPLRIGSGTRLKILEAGAMGKAMVSTRLGAEGLQFEEGREILLADHGQEFAAQVAALLQDHGRRVEMGESARKRVASDYSQTVLEGQLEQALTMAHPIATPPPRRAMELA